MALAVVTIICLAIAVAGLTSENRELRRELRGHMDDAADLRRSKRAGMRRLCEWVER